MFEHNHENGKDNMNNAQNQGFNETPLEESERFYRAGQADDNGMYPVKIVESFDLSNLPSIKEFLEKCEPDEEEHTGGQQAPEKASYSPQGGSSRSRRYGGVLRLHPVLSVH